MSLLLFSAGICISARTDSQTYVLDNVRFLVKIKNDARLHKLHLWSLKSRQVSHYFGAMNEKPPTYSTEEVLTMMGYIDSDGLRLLGQIVNEEMACYALFDFCLISEVWNICSVLENIVH